MLGHPPYIVDPCSPPAFFCSDDFSAHVRALFPVCLLVALQPLMSSFLLSVRASLRSLLRGRPCRADIGRRWTTRLPRCQRGGQQELRLRLLPQGDLNSAAFPPRARVIERTINRQQRLSRARFSRCACGLPRRVLLFTSPVSFDASPSTSSGSNSGPSSLGIPEHNIPVHRARRSAASFVPSFILSSHTTGVFLI